MKIFVILFLCFLNFTACETGSQTSNNQTNQAAENGLTGEKITASNNSTASAANSANTVNSNIENFQSQNNQPKTVRDFFKLLPSKYFTLEGCESAKDTNCEKARVEYLKNFLEIEDIPNGYMKGGCDGAQTCLVLALFKRPNGTYLVALNTEFEMSTTNYFLNYENGNWTDISAQIVPQFSKKNIYELPRQGTTVQVFAKKMTDDYEDGKGAKLYDLEWKDGKFTKR